MLSHIRRLALFIVITMAIGALAALANPAIASSQAQNKESIVNSAKLAPTKTGYRPLDAVVEDVLKKLVSDNMSAYNKMKALYDYMIINYAGGSGSYGGKTGPTRPEFKIDYSLGKKPYYTSSVDNSIVDRALTIIETHRGTCLHYSSAFVVFARALGFESYRMYGKTAMARGGMGEHYWPVVIINGKEYVFDAQVDDHIAAGGQIKYWRFCLDKNETSRYFSLARPVSTQINEHNNFDMPTLASVKPKSFTIKSDTLTENAQAKLEVEVNNPDNFDLLYSYYYLKGLEEPAKIEQHWRAIEVNTKNKINWTPDEEGVYTLKASVKQRGSNTSLFSQTLVAEVEKDGTPYLSSDSTAILLGNPLILKLNNLPTMGEGLLYDFSYSLDGSKKAEYLTQKSNSDTITFVPKLAGKYLFEASVHTGKDILKAKPLSVIVCEEYKKGDLNLDGKITAKDSRLALLIACSLSKANSLQKLSGDVNGDGLITSSDARAILRVSAGLDSFN